MDKVVINNLEVEAVIGIFQWEREVGQLISVDIEMDFDNKPAARSDDIEDALNYKLVGKRVTSFIKNSKFKLVETLAEKIAQIILKEFPISKIKEIVRETVDEELFALSYDYVGDLAETISLIWPNKKNGNLPQISKNCKKIRNLMI